MGNINQKYNSLKPIWHRDKLKSFVDGKITAPIYIRIKPTNHCNHHCFYCAYDPDFDYILSERFKRQDEIPLEKMREILADLKEIGVKAVTFSGGGEPLIYPHIEETMEKILEYGIDLSIITNGQELRDKKAELLARAKWVRISLDASDSKTFAEIRRVSEDLFNQLIENIKNFSKIKNPSCEFGINFVVNHKNADKVYDSIKFFRDLGVNHIKITPLYTPDGFVEYHAPFKEEVIEQIKRAKQELTTDSFAVFDTYENDFSLSSTSTRGYKKCLMMQTVPVIAADSCVYFCHDKAYAESGILGSLKDQSLKDLWFSEEAAEIFKNFNPQKSCRHHCTADTRNMLMNDAIDCYGEHINFI
jgi:MoaA/NifB/PqqE/SkfB family radical SAM enzyme